MSAAVSTRTGSEPPSLARSQSLTIDTALASEVFDLFCNASTLKSILRSFRYLCEILRIKPTQFPYFYPKLKSKLNSWKAQALWAKFDKRSSHKVYGRGKVCANQRVLVIGAGPCGLRTAIEAQLLGAKVVVIEKRDRYSRNNVLHLWPYNIVDLRGLGAKKFYGKFCAGSIDHISIRQLQCILLKVALLLGVEIFENVTFEDMIEPTSIESGWRARISPTDHPVSQYEFDVLIGADGKRNTLKGFKRKEFRGKLAIAITVNFINKHTEAESQVEEISGVAFIFNQKFFNDLNEAKGISLENIVYYKDETHYFVMTAKKQSLLDKGVIIKNDPDTAKLLAQDNINQEALFNYAREAASFATNYQLPDLEFAVNHYGKPDVAMFDFTSMFQAENSCRMFERHGHRLLQCLVGDSLLEPFWPTGTGCPRGFFGGLDACWLMRSLSLGKMTALECLSERESIYRMLAQTTPENTSKDFASYTVDPHTRYPTLNTKQVLPFQVTHLFDTDDPSQQEVQSAYGNGVPAQKRSRKESNVLPDTLLTWFQRQVESYEQIVVPSDMTFSFQDGTVLCAIIHRYRPDLIDLSTLTSNAEENNQLAFDILEFDLGIPPAMTGRELANAPSPDKLTMISYLSQVYEVFRKDIPSVQKAEVSDDDLLDSQYRHNHERFERNTRRGRYHENGKMSIGQLVAKEAGTKKKKTRRSRDSTECAADEEMAADQPNKENQSANRSANRKRLAKLMERAAASEEKLKKKALQLERKSIKKEERYRIIEEQFAGGPKRRSDHAKQYRESKRPKEIKRAIGKLDKDDWQFKVIEDKLLTKKDPETSKGGKVPKWSKAAFQDKFNIMKGKLETGEDPGDRKYTDIDTSLAKLQRKLREGSTLEAGKRGSNKVSALAEELFSKPKKSVPSQPPPRRSDSATQFILPAKGGSETCHFCSKRVYVVERMSAEGKFFHRSCFRCDYCNILLRLGSYVYHREGPFAGKFFCIPHSTDYSLEKFRYRHKKDEIKDADVRVKDTHHEANNEWNYLSSLSPQHKERLLTHMEAEFRGTTPERAEFEASVDGQSEDGDRNIMDEDEWTDRNFGNSFTGENVDTSDDSVSDLESDSEDEDEADERPEDAPLTANEARQLSREWIKKFDPGTDSDSDYAQKNRSSNDEEADDEDGEDDSDDDEDRPRPLQLQPPRRPPPPAVCSRDSETTGSSTEVGSEDLSSDEDSFSDFEASATDTECEFTDSEGRPNPFHKQLDIPKIVIQPGSPRVERAEPKREYVSQKVPLDQQPPSLSSSLTYSTKYQYKTPNISDRLKQDHEKMPSTTGASTRRALNLKKNWVSDASNNSTTSANKVDKTDIDNRLKSLMERLSCQQKLLKPAEKHSNEMEHFLRSSQSSSKMYSTGGSLSLTGPSSIEATTSPGSQPSSLRNMSGPPLYKSMATEELPANAPVVQEVIETVKEEVREEVVPENKKKPEDIIETKKDEPAFEDVETIVVPDLPKNNESKDYSSTDSSDDSSSESATSSSSPSSEEEEEEDLAVEQKMCDVKVEESAQSEEEEKVAFDSSKDEYHSLNDVDVEDDVINEAVNRDILKETPKNDNEMKTDVANLVESTNVNGNEDLNDNYNGRSVLKEEPVVIENVDKPELKPIVKLTDDEITKIYRERNPLERIAKYNSYKQKQSSVIHDMIMSRITQRDRLNRKAPSPARQMPSNGPPPIPQDTQDDDPRPADPVPADPVSPTMPDEPVQPPVEPRPVDPKPEAAPPATPIDHKSLSAADKDFPLIDGDDDDQSSAQSTPAKKMLPATPLTDPEKFGIPVKKSKAAKSTPVRGTSKTRQTMSPIDSSSSHDLEYMDGIVSTDDSAPASPNKVAAAKAKTDKKSFMQTISGMFRSSSTPASSRSRVTSPESPVRSSADPEKQKALRLPKFMSREKLTSPPSTPSSPEAPRANISEMESLSAAKNPVLFRTASLTLQPSHPSTPPFPLSRKISIVAQNPPQASEDSFSEDDEPSSAAAIPRPSTHVPPEILEKIMRRGGGKSAKRAARVAQLKRIRRAQEIQRQLEELDVQHKDLEDRGISLEQSLRGETSSESSEAELMRVWFQLLAEKNRLVRHEQELLVQAKQLELEDQGARKECELREHLVQESKSKEHVVKEGEILQELLEITEQRELLQAMLERDKVRYQKEDKDIEEQMLAKGLTIQ